MWLFCNSSCKVVNFTLLWFYRILGEKGKQMDEMAEVMNEFEKRLEEALENIEHDYATPEDIAVIRAACGKPKEKKK